MDSEVIILIILLIIGFLFGITKKYKSDDLDYKIAMAKAQLEWIGSREWEEYQRQMDQLVNQKWKNYIQYPVSFSNHYWKPIAKP